MLPCVGSAIAKRANLAGFPIFKVYHENDKVSENR